MGSRQCRLGGMSCTTRRAYKNGSGTATAYLPAGYVATGGGMYNHYHAWNRKAAFETSMPVGNRAWRCDMGLGASVLLLRAWVPCSLLQETPVHHSPVSQRQLAQCAVPAWLCCDRLWSERTSSPVESSVWLRGDEGAWKWLCL